jgi:hypothetical protein
MNRGHIVLSDRGLAAAYLKFQEIRRLQGQIYPGTCYDDFVDRGIYQGSALRVTMMAREHILSAANAVNRFCYDLHGLTAWAEILDHLPDDEKIPILFEFVQPIADHCLSSPYSTRQMLIKSVCHISHQTHRFLSANWSDSSLKRDRWLDIEKAKKLASCFDSWPAFCAALARLNDDQFVLATDDYRSRLNHGFRRRVEFGHTMTFLRNPDSPSYNFYDASPLRISDLIPPLDGQYKAAFDGYSRYIELIREQQKIWPAVAP